MSGDENQIFYQITQEIRENEWTIAEMSSGEIADRRVEITGPDGKKNDH